MRGQGGEACTRGLTTVTTSGPEFMGGKSPDLGLTASRAPTSHFFTQDPPPSFLPATWT